MDRARVMHAQKDRESSSSSSSSRIIPTQLQPNSTTASTNSAPYLHQPPSNSQLRQQRSLPPLGNGIGSGSMSISSMLGINVGTDRGTAAGATNGKKYGEQQHQHDGTAERFLYTSSSSGNNNNNSSSSSRTPRNRRERNFELQRDRFQGPLPAPAPAALHRRQVSSHTLEPVGLGAMFHQDLDREREREWERELERNRERDRENLPLGASLRRPNSQPPQLHPPPGFLRDHHAKRQYSPSLGSGLHSQYQQHLYSLNHANLSSASAPVSATATFHNHSSSIPYLRQSPLNRPQTMFGSAPNSSLGEHRKTPSGSLGEPGKPMVSTIEGPGSDRSMVRTKSGDITHEDMHKKREASALSAPSQIGGSSTRFGGGSGTGFGFADRATTNRDREREKEREREQQARFGAQIIEREVDRERARWLQQQQQQQQQHARSHVQPVSDGRPLSHVPRDNPSNTGYAQHYPEQLHQAPPASEMPWKRISNDDRNLNLDREQNTSSPTPSISGLGAPGPTLPRIGHHVSSASGRWFESDPRAALHSSAPAPVSTASHQDPTAFSTDIGSVKKATTSWSPRARVRTPLSGNAIASAEKRSLPALDRQTLPMPQPHIHSNHPAHHHQQQPQSQPQPVNRHHFPTTAAGSSSSYSPALSSHPHPHPHTQMPQYSDSNSHGHHYHHQQPLSSQDTGKPPYPAQEPSHRAVSVGTSAPSLTTAQSSVSSVPVTTPTVAVSAAARTSTPHQHFSVPTNILPGRASPIPQAVQGAQAQPGLDALGLGPAVSEDVKGEMGRVFVGLGSGIGAGLRGSSVSPGGAAAAPSSGFGPCHRFAGSGAGAGAGPTSAPSLGASEAAARLATEESKRLAAALAGPPPTDRTGSAVPDASARESSVASTSLSRLGRKLTPAEAGAGQDYLPPATIRVGDGNASVSGSANAAAAVVASLGSAKRRQHAHHHHHHYHHHHHHRPRNQRAATSEDERQVAHHHHHPTRPLSHQSHNLQASPMPTQPNGGPSAIAGPPAVLHRPSPPDANNIVPGDNRRHDRPRVHQHLLRAAQDLPQHESPSKRLPGPSTVSAGQQPFPLTLEKSNQQHSGEPANASLSSHEYRTRVNLEPILQSVAHLPRRHLGSILYEPKIGTPSFRASSSFSQNASSYDKFGYTSTARPPPRFYGKENCTFTVRVPRWYLSARKREEICYRRALWGTGVYTDDSDPVAAAIHSGLIRGCWNEDVDVEMLDLLVRKEHGLAPSVDRKENEGPIAPAETKNRKERKRKGESPVPRGRSLDSYKRVSPSPVVLRSKNPSVPPMPLSLPSETAQAAPAEPVQGKDLHITLLVLPPLKNYDSSIMYGVRSRPWGGTHDGMSFMVLAINWIDEGAGSRGQPRGGGAKRKRMAYLMDAGMIWTPGAKEADEPKCKIRSVESALDGPAWSASRTIKALS